MFVLCKWMFNLRERERERERTRWAKTGHERKLCEALLSSFYIFSLHYFFHFLLRFTAEQCSFFELLEWTIVGRRRRRSAFVGNAETSNSVEFCLSPACLLWFNIADPERCQNTTQPTTKTNGLMEDFRVVRFGVWAKQKKRTTNFSFHLKFSLLDSFIRNERIGVQSEFCVWLFSLTLNTSLSRWIVSLC